MLFNSTEFFGFFVLVLWLFYVIPNRFRWFLLLIGSYIFYMSWEPGYILLILFSTIVDYFVSHRMIITKNYVKKTRLLWVSIIVNLGLLFVFKYYNFFNEIIANALILFNIEYHPIVSNLLLPVGISFYTFQTLSYSIDVYRGELKPEKHFGKFALYVSFFPQLVAGPIERATNLLPQLQKTNTRLNYTNFTTGLSQFTYGLFKKVVVADTAALYVDSIFLNYQLNSGFTLIVATIIFAIQIYGDFSGYSDMAIGSARMMGFKLMDNFHLPYFSKSTTEIWRRWHISLGSWANDYIFKSIAPAWVRRFKKNGAVISLIITFALIGLWHGARLTYVLFGLLHGLILGIEFLTKKRRKKIRKRIGKNYHNIIGWMITMILWLISMVIFRSNTMEQATHILNQIFYSQNFWYLNITDHTVFANILVGSFILFALDFLLFRRNSFLDITNEKSIFWMAGFNIFFILLVILFGVSNGSQFIYFQF